MGKRRNLIDITGIVIHCADTPNGRKNTAADLDLWHRERGFTRDLSIAPEHQPDFNAIGYHYVIETDGNIVPGRPLIETGSHVAGGNSHTVGICMIGRDKFSAEQWNSLHHLVVEICTQIPSCIHVVGHRDLNPGKTCPGFDVKNWIDNEYIPETSLIFTEAEA